MDMIKYDGKFTREQFESFLNKIFSRRVPVDRIVSVPFHTQESAREFDRVLREYIRGCGEM